MVERSLQTSQDGIQIAKTALVGKRLTQQALANALNVTRQPISKFFNGKAVDRELFVRICEFLGVEWEAIAVKTESEPKESAEAINTLVQEIREGIRSLIQEQCGTMRVLDMPQPIKLTGDEGIYTNVNILEKITGRKRLEIAQLFQNADLEVFDRFGLSSVKEKRVPGVEAVREHRKLMVLGKPGAGKTTFLKYLAMNCIEGNFLANHVPIFITLKDFAEADRRPSLLTYIQKNITHNTAVQNIIQQGRLFVLLDGLDEVREEDTKRVLQQIQEFSNQFADNHFVITCRIAAKEYVFERFTEVEVADFDDEQISNFIHNWFRCRDPEKGEGFAQRIIEKLDENKPIKELANNPLLLTLLCLECEESIEFPRNRADLYERGLKVLLSKWDASRKIERHQIYEKLSLNRKEDLLSQLARKTFEQKDYFFKQRTIEQFIADYIINLPDAQTDPKALQLDSELVLKSIEAQHGLLVERAKGIYSFSHLTFQEYFTAKEIFNNADCEKIARHVKDKRWCEVFLLITNIMPKADRLLLAMKDAVDEIIKKDNELQACLQWIHEKACSIKEMDETCAIRLIYLEFVCRRHSTSFVPFYDFQDILKLAKYFDKGLWTIYESYAIKSRPIYEEHHSLTNQELLNVIKNEIYSRYKIIPDLAIDHALDYSLRLAGSINRASSSSKNERFFVSPDAFLYCYISFINDVDSSLGALCPRLRRQPRDIGANNQINATFQKWWQEVGVSWIKQLRKIMIQNRNIGHDWQFSEEQKERLQQYYDANKLLVHCLNSDCYVSRDVRQEIEETLLLPMTEIEARKKA